MKKTIIKAVYAILIFAAALFITDHFMNRATTDMTTEMGSATFPLVYMVRDGQRFNCIRGTILEGETAFVNESITPVDAASRKLDMEIDAYTNHISKVMYEVRDTSGERLIENGEITDLDQEGSTVSLSITLKDLLEVGEEYVLRLEIGNTPASSICFDARICLMENMELLDQAMGFALDFSDRCFDKEKARALTMYLESNAEGDNTTFSRVDIHSSFSQITWGSLDVRPRAKPMVLVKRINPYVAAVRLEYPLMLKNGPTEEDYNVNEYYYIRFGKERIFLLDYVRTMNSVFDPRAAVYSNNKISLGISDPESVELAESEDGNVLAFVKENALYSFNTSDNKVAKVFSFRDEGSGDPRESYDGSDIMILNIDETGNIRFLVRGYMNRGIHEGGVGVACYYYNSVLNTVEEEIYIPFYTSADHLKQGIGKLSYANSSNKLFLLFDKKLYRIDLTDKSYEVLQDEMNYGSYFVSQDRHLVAWTEGEDENSAQVIYLLNLSTGRKSEISVEDGRLIKPLGFVGEDLVYGIANAADLTFDEFGNTVFLMSSIIICDENSNVEKEYGKTGIYVTDADVTKERIGLKRVSKGMGDTLAKVEDDYIMNDSPESETKNAIEVVATQNLEKVVQVAIRSSFSSSKMKVLTPRQVLYEGQRQLFITNRQEERPYYFVYDMYGISDICLKEKNAVSAAEEKNGRVLDGKGNCIWERSSRSSSHQILSITPAAADGGKSAVAVCLEAMLKNEGISLDCERLLQSGSSIMNILQKNMSGSRILDLSGCSLESVLYYVGHDIPVMAMLHDGSAVLLVGYNEQNTIMLQPATGKIIKMGIKDSADYFEANGNRFITYRKES